MMAQSRLDSMAMQRYTGHMGRGNVKARLLDDADANIGNGAIITAQPFPQGPLGPPNLKPESNPARILNLDALSTTGQTVTVTFTASLLQGVFSFESGPITGIIEFGNGAVFTRVEFDISIGPVGSVGGGAPGSGTPTEPQDGGVTITVPSGVLRAYARHDGAYMTPDIFGKLPNNPPAGTPSTCISPHTTNVQIFAKAFAGYYTRHFSRLYKTQYIFRCDQSNVANSSVIYNLYPIPAFAKSVRLLRNIITSSSLKLYIYDGIPIIATPPFPAPPYSSDGNLLDVVQIPAGISCPTIPLPGTATCILVETTGGTVVNFAALLYEIGL